MYSVAWSDPYPPTSLKRTLRNCKLADPKVWYIKISELQIYEVWFSNALDSQMRMVSEDYIDLWNRFK